MQGTDNELQKLGATNRLGFLWEKEEDVAPQQQAPLALPPVEAAEEKR